MNKKELMIISALRQDSRKSLTIMSKEIKIPVSTLHEKIQGYSADLIKKHTAIVDFSKLGYNTRANVLIKAEKEQRQEIQDFLSATKNVNSLLKVNNGFDFLVEFVFEHIKDLEDFMEALEQKYKIVAKETYYVIEDIRREEFMANPSMSAISSV